MRFQNRMINREFTLRKKFLHHRFLVLVLGALPASARAVIVSPTQ